MRLVPQAKPKVGVEQRNVIIDREILKRLDDAANNLFLFKSVSKRNNFITMKCKILKTKQDAGL